MTGKADSFSKPPTTHEAVLLELRRLITNGQLPPGTQIIQEALAAEFGVSRVPLREALKMLEADGLVVYRPHRGYFVTDLSVEDLYEVHRLRKILEDEALTIALDKLTEADLKQVRGHLAAVKRAARSDDIAGMIDANRRFRFAVMEVSGMPRLMHLIRTLWNATDSHQYIYYATKRHRDLTIKAYEAVLRAAEAGDNLEVIRLFDEHRQNSVRSLQAMVEARDNEPTRPGGSPPPIRSRS